MPDFIVAIGDKNATDKLIVTGLSLLFYSGLILSVDEK